MAQTETTRIEELFSEAAKAVPPGPPMSFSAGAADRVNFTGGFPDPKSMPKKFWLPLNNNLIQPGITRSWL